ncbi:MAG: PD-(D/E)XK nuclease family protein [Caldilineaceae bacterium]|nr:PD-(D/E)XK nuclease family protein [Caldilineaceae bacterium]
MTPTLPVTQRLPETFAFSQSSLQAYSDCPRRFWLAYVEQLPWPAVEASPVHEYEERMRQGARFHRLIERAEIGMEPDVIAAGLDHPLDDWFAKYQRFRPADLPGDVLEVEKTLSTPVAVAGRAYRLAAKYDLIAVEPRRRAIIMDWKSASRRGDEGQLRRRWQSRVYPYVLVEASRALPWGPLAPHQVEMRYWFTAAPSRPVTLPYSDALHAANHEQLHALMTEIVSGAAEDDYPKVADTPLNRKRFCAYCIYRSRCDRGEAAGDLDDLADAEEFFAVDPAVALEFTLDDVAEIEF